MRIFGRLLLVSLFPLSAINCYSPVALDTTLPSLTKTYVSSACPAGEDLLTIDLSVILLTQSDQDTGSSSLLPDSRVKQERSTVDELLNTSSFQFQLPAIAREDAPGVNTSAFSTPEMMLNDVQPLNLSPVDINYEHVTPPESDKKRLVILLMDQSGSLLGESPDPLLPPDVNNEATDLQNEHLTFFQGFVNNLPDDFYVSVLSFKEAASSWLNVDDDSKIPTDNRSKVSQRLQELSTANEKKGGTPLADVLADTLELIEMYNTDYSPTVVLFTDGTELGDTSSRGRSLEELSQEYASIGVPVNVIDLQPPPTVANQERRGRHSEFAALACQTKGDYLFIKSVTEFTKNNALSPILLSRIIGRWKLTVQTDLTNQNKFPEGQGYLINTELQVSLGEQSETYPIARSADPNNPSGDTRLWIFKK